MPIAAAATSQPPLPRRRPAAYSANGDRLASTSPSLRLQGPRMPLRRSTAAVSSRLHMGRPLIACLAASIPANSGLVPVSACSSASAVQMPTMTANPPKVSRRPRSLATAEAASHRNGR
jgi:hypothetical protein